MSISWGYTDIEVWVDIPLNELHRALWALAVGLTAVSWCSVSVMVVPLRSCPLVVWTLKLHKVMPCMPTVTLTSPSCFTLCAPGKKHSGIFLLAFFLSAFYHLCSPLPVVQREEMKCVCICQWARWFISCHIKNIRDLVAHCNSAF